MEPEVSFSVFLGTSGIQGNPYEIMSWKKATAKRLTIEKDIPILHQWESDRYLLFCASPSTYFKPTQFQGKISLPFGADLYFTEREC